MQTTATQARTAILAQMREREVQLIAARDGLRHMLLGEGFIVECDGISLTFDVVDGFAEQARNCRPENCIRFDLATATRLAANVTNGRGTKGNAIHVRHAVEKALSECREVIAMVEQTETA